MKRWSHTTSGLKENPLCVVLLAELQARSSRHFLRKRSRRTTSAVESPLPDTGGGGGVVAVVVCDAGSFLSGGLGGFAGASFAGEGFSTGAGFVVTARISAVTSLLVPLVASPSTANSSPNGTEGSMNAF